MSYAKLRGRIKEFYGTQDAFAESIGMNAATLSGKLTGKSDWSRSEMELSCEKLHIDMREMHLFFFDSKIEKTQQEV